MKTADTDLARQVRDIMAAGGYLTDEITNAIVADRLRLLSWNGSMTSRCGEI